MSLRRALAHRLTGLAVSRLPPEIRSRYREEFAADLDQLHDGDALRYAAATTLHAGGLAHELRSAHGASRTLACRLHLHRSQLVHDNPEDPTIASLRCRQCGARRDGVDYAPLPIDDPAWLLANGGPSRVGPPTGIL